MAELIKIKTELLRRQFHIYGFFNIASLCGVLAGIVIAEKWLLMRAGHYDAVVFWLNLYYFALFSGMLAGEDPKGNREMLFFSAVKRKSMRIYARYYRFVIYEAVSFLLFFPAEWTFWKSFLLCFCLQQILLAVFFWFKGKVKGARFSMLQGSLAVWVSMAAVLAARYKAIMPVFSDWVPGKTCLFSLIGFLCLLYSVYAQSEEKSEPSGRPFPGGRTGNGVFLRKYPEMLVLLRNQHLFESIVLVLLTGVEIPSYLGDKNQILIAYALSFAAAQTYLFLEIIQAGQKTVLFMLYTRKMRLNAALCALYMAPSLFLAAVAGNLFHTELLLLLKAGLTGAGTAFLTHVFLPFPQRKPDGKQAWITGKTTLGFYVSCMVLCLAVLSV